MHQIRQYHLDNIHEIAAWLLNHLEDIRVITFEGQLGAGKTTLIQAIGKELGVQQGIDSPSFGMVNEYEGELGKFKTIYHMDWYRLKSEDEAWESGLDQYFHDPAGLCLIEWPSKATGLLPKKYLACTILILNETEREIQVRCL